MRSSINHYPVDKYDENQSSYPVDRDLSNGQCYLPFELQEPEAVLQVNHVSILKWITTSKKFCPINGSEKRLYLHRQKCCAVPSILTLTPMTLPTGTHLHKGSRLPINTILKFFAGLTHSSPSTSYNHSH